MAVLTKPKSNGSHWYTEKGIAMHEVPTVDGQSTKSTTLKEARILGLYPSVTNILSNIRKPQLEKWGNQQVAKASLTVTKKSGESDEYWINRVIDKAFEQVDQAADVGSKFHDVLRNWIVGDDVSSQLQETVVFPTTGHRHKIESCLVGAFNFIHEKGITIKDPESVVVNTKHGFAGTVDSPYYTEKSFGVMDFKSRKTKPNRKVYAYDGQLEQIAAYGATYWGEENLGKCWGLNMYISTTEAGRVDLIIYKPEELITAFRKFCLLCEVWRIDNRFDPRGIDEYPSSGVKGKVDTISPALDVKPEEVVTEEPKETIFDSNQKGDGDQHRDQTAKEPPVHKEEAVSTTSEAEVHAKSLKTKQEAKAAAAKALGDRTEIEIDVDKVVMPSGKHKGELLKDLPHEYLKKIRCQPKLMEKYPELKAYFEDEHIVRAMEDAG